MKPAPTRRLHMGCGESLLGLLPSRPEVKRLPVLPSKPLMKRGEGDRCQRGKRK